MKNNNLLSLSLSLASAGLCTSLANIYLPGANATTPFASSATLGLFIIFFAACSTLVRLGFWFIESKRQTSGRTIATFNLRSQELAAVRLLLAQGKSNEALAYMQGLSNATKQ